ncbi:hypothetical protein A4A49_64318 [Nicotiana attenuata]|uniref:Uncharacterized protein n=1 Tax=Nicotiana attenuata TaxID=49451 RepID=A0A1J6JA97_NICAT|nr:hypothetical protein A4A49_64318 [Nicotiana attenuata]
MFCVLCSILPPFSVYQSIILDYRRYIRNLFSATKESKLPHGNRILTNRPLLWNGVNTSIILTFKVYSLPSNRHGLPNI